MVETTVDKREGAPQAIAEVLAAERAIEEMEVSQTLKMVTRAKTDDRRRLLQIK